MLKLFVKTLCAFKRDEEGVTAIEYGLIAAGISLLIAVAVGAFGDELVLMFEGMTSSLQAVGSEAETTT